MHFINAIFTASLLCGTTVLALPQQSNQTRWDFSKAQKYSRASNNTIDRRTDVPAACDFPIGEALWDDLWYLEASDDTGGTICLGWLSESGCGSAYTNAQLGRMGTAMSQQLKKDGAFTATTDDLWEASFMYPPTTAFSVRDEDEWSEVIEGLQNNKDNEKYWNIQWYWGVDNDGLNYAQVHRTSCP